MMLQQVALIRIVIVLLVGATTTTSCITPEPAPPVVPSANAETGGLENAVALDPPAIEEVEDWHREESFAAIVEAFAGEDGSLRFLDVYQDHWTWTYVGFAMLRSGEHLRAIKAYRKVLEINPDFTPAIYNMACAASLLGQSDEALEIVQLLGSKVRERPSLQAKYADFLDTDPDLARLRDHPRFEQARRLFGSDK